MRFLLHLCDMLNYHLISSNLSMFLDVRFLNAVNMMNYKILIRSGLKMQFLQLPRGLPVAKGTLLLALTLMVPRSPALNFCLTNQKLFHVMVSCTLRIILLFLRFVFAFLFLVILKLFKSLPKLATL